MTQISLIEPSFADLVAALESANDLSPSLRSHLLCSVRQIGKAIDRPLELIPARWTSVRHPVERLHHARVGVTPKTWQTTKPTFGPLSGGLPRRRTFPPGEPGSMPSGTGSASNSPTGAPERF